MTDAPGPSRTQVLELETSETESQRFDYRILRARAAGVDGKAIEAALFKHEPDILILRIPSESLWQVPRLDRTGFPYIVADTLLYYRVDLTRHEPRPLRNETLEFHECRSEDAPALGKLVREIFPGYTNHYFSNPYLDRGRLLDAFEDWAVRYIAGKDRTAWLARLDGTPVAFATCSLRGSESEGVLYGVSPAVSGRGIYGDLIRFTQMHHKTHGAKQMTVSTQPQNYAVQTVWNREGFMLVKSVTTVHINSMLAKSVVEKRELDFRVSADEIGACGRFSGDMNPLHFDDTFAQGIGFEGRIAHGLVGSSAISKYYGTEFPGPGTLFLGSSCKFSKPVYPGRNYRLLFSFPYIDRGRGIYRALAKLTDDRGAACLLCYSDLYRKP